MRMQHSTKPVYDWCRVPAEQVEQWNERLLSTGAAHFQFPYWTEPYRRLGFSIVYLECASDGRPYAYAAMLCVGVPGFRIGLIDQGPINLVDGSVVDFESLQSLRKWACRHGFAFLRFTHFDAEVLDRVASVDGARRVNAFPFYGSKSTGLFVEMKEDEEELLASFQRVARRNIRDARKAGYEIRSSDSAEEFAKTWPLFESLAQRRGIRFYRPVQGWADLVRRASEHDCVRLYTAHLAGKIVEAIVIVRGSHCAEYILGAYDPDAAKDETSPSCLLHWHAMRQAVAWGCRWYDLGPRTSPAIYQFKSKFRPVERIASPPVTLVTNRITYLLWSSVFLRVVLPLWPRIRALLARLLGAK
jgi:hypothetical protein